MQGRASTEATVIRSSIVATLLVLRSAASIDVPAQSAAASRDEMITIDGTRNPELVPQWNVWAAGFRYMAKDDVEQLPTVVLRAVTPEQRVAVMKEANAAASFDRECGMRAADVGRRLLAEKPDVGVDLANARVLEASMSCRRHTLEVRDKLLVDLGPAGAAALTGWVESLKNGWTTTLRKSQLKAYLLPE
jgi:hypothetical protein